MIAFPIPTSDAVPPLIVVVFAIIAAGGLAVLIVQAVRYFRHGDDDHDQFGPRT